MMTLKEIKPDDPNYYKPLEELIEDLGHAEPASRYGDVQIMAEDLTDAIHYLREYKQTRQDLLDGMKRLEGRELMYIHALANLEDNPPLDWETLKQMEGKPVWIECKFYSSRWAVITDVDDVRIRFVGKQLLDSEKVQEMGTTWQAYRKERS